MTAADQPRNDASNLTQKLQDRGLRPTPGLPALIDVETLASALGVGVRHVRRLVAERRIPYIRIGHYVRFDTEDVAAWVQARRVTPVGAGGKGGREPVRRGRR